MLQKSPVTYKVSLLPDGPARARISGKKKRGPRWPRFKTSLGGGGGALTDQIGGQVNQRVSIF